MIPGAKTRTSLIPAALFCWGEMKSKELSICGLVAVQARFNRDAASVQRLFFEATMARKLGAICRKLANEKKVYRTVTAAELEKISGSVHHGGVVAVVNAPVLKAPSPTELRLWVSQRATVLVLDRIGNAHNLGALARTAAFFGVRQLVIPDSPEAARPNDAAFRVSEGGLEQMTVWCVRDLAGFVKQLAATGYDVIGASTRGGRPTAMPESRRPLAVVMGNEEQGLAPSVAAACTRLVTIPGAGGIESLNVSVAGAVLLWEYIGRRGSLASAGPNV